MGIVVKNVNIFSLRKNIFLFYRSEKKVNVQNNSACAKRFISTWLLFDEKIKHRNCLLLRGVTAVTTITVSVFNLNIIYMYHNK